MNLQHFWASQGCVVLQPYDNAVGHQPSGHDAAQLWGAGHLAHGLTCRAAAVHRRPLRREPQPPAVLLPVQVLIKPSPDNIQDLYLDSLRAIGIGQ